VESMEGSTDVSQVGAAPARPSARPIRLAALPPPRGGEVPQADQGGRRPRLLFQELDGAVQGLDCHAVSDEVLLERLGRVAMLQSQRLQLHAELQVLRLALRDLGGQLRLLHFQSADVRLERLDLDLQLVE